MAIRLDIHKNIGEFQLNIHADSDSKRIGILGASGCGKSMTLKCIAGIETPDSGLIRLEDRVLYDSEHKINPKPQKRNVGYLFQNYALFPTMTVRDNIGAGIRKNKKDRMEKISYLIDKFQLQGLEKHYPMQLSGGQQQRVALARIMAYEPDAILLDEPFSALDVYLKEKLQHELLQMLADYPGTVIMVSHSRDEIYRFSEDLMIIDQGETIAFGKTKELFFDPKRKAAARLTGCKNIVPVKVVDEHTLYISDWNTRLVLKRKIASSVQYIGIRAHDFIPVWGQDSLNCISVYSAKMDELPFEKKYYIKTRQEQKEDICWFLQREQWHMLEEYGMPNYLHLPEDKLLFLTE